MLPAFKRTAIAGFTALAIAATAAAPAQAWGDNEQNFVKGIAATLLVQGIIREAKRGERNQPVYYADPQPQPVYVAPRAHTSIYRTAAAQAFNSYSTRERVLIQKRLSRYGYYRGGIDGSFGPGTYSAVTAYADDQGQGGDLRSTAGAFGVYDGLIY